MKTAERRQNLKDTLITLAERIIDRQGLSAVRARDLAAQAGCAVGAIYNVFADLDDVILGVNQRTLFEIEAELARSAGLAKAGDSEDPPMPAGRVGGGHPAPAISGRADCVSIVQK